MVESVDSAKPHITFVNSFLHITVILGDGKDFFFFFDDGMVFYFRNEWTIHLKCFQYSTAGCVRFHFNFIILRIIYFFVLVKNLFFTEIPSKKH